jgi:hypothetical protein
LFGRSHALFVAHHEVLADGAASGAQGHKAVANYFKVAETQLTGSTPDTPTSALSRLN